VLVPFKGTLLIP